MAAPSGPVRIVTISRQYGSGGGEVARIVGRGLGWRVIDHALIEEVARRIQAPEAELAVLDEHVGGIVERIAAVFARGSPEAPVATALPDADTVASIEHAVLRDALWHLPFVVVGHGAQCLYADRPDALHVRIVAPRSARVHRIAERQGLDHDAAGREVERHDVDARRYIHHHFGCELDDPVLYTLQLNTGSLSLERAASLVLQLVEWRQAPVTAAELAAT